MAPVINQPWAAQLPAAIPLSELLHVAEQAGEDAAFSVFAPDDSVELADRRGYVALVIAYTRFEEPVAILDDGCCALLIRDGGTSAASAASRRILTQAARLGLASQLRVGVAPIHDSPEAALRAARIEAASGEPGAIAGAA
jgi:hypothetical protein